VTLQAAGQPVETEDLGGVTLRFKADGSYQTPLDCNYTSGDYTADERGALRLPPPYVTSTAACNPTPTRKSQIDGRHVTTLYQARGYVVEGDTLRLTFDRPGLQLVYRRANP
jgi:hypothetical protein